MCEQLDRTMTCMMRSVLVFIPLLFIIVSEIEIASVKCELVKHKVSRDMPNTDDLIVERKKPHK